MNLNEKKQVNGNASIIRLTAKTVECFYQGLHMNRDSMKSGMKITVTVFSFSCWSQASCCTARSDRDILEIDEEKDFIFTKKPRYGVG